MPVIPRTPADEATSAEDANPAGTPIPPEGAVLLVDKPAGKTSHDVVALVRRELPGKTKVGHAGTLDPFATGLLLILVGRATRAQRFLMALPKTYRVVARLGATSTTGDPEGEIAEHRRAAARSPRAAHRRGAPAPAGALGGQGGGGTRVPARAPGRGRRSRAERTVTVHRFELLTRDEDRAEFEIECSSGTYVRSLIADLGDAYCEQLRRTAIGPFQVERRRPRRARSPSAPR